MFKRYVYLNNMDAQLRSSYISLINSLRALALPYEEQQALMPDFVFALYDLPETFYESGFILLPQIVEAGLLSNETIATLIRIEIAISGINWQQMDSISKDEVISQPVWEKLHTLAKEALNSMDEKIVKPYTEEFNFYRSSDKE